MNDKIIPYKDQYECRDLKICFLAHIEPLLLQAAPAAAVPATARCNR